MNQENYCSLNLAQKLVDAGIVLETDYKWFCRNGIWGLVDICCYLPLGAPHIPAPSMAEVWRELPAGVSVYKGTAIEVANTTACMVDRVKTPYIERTNPTDALIDLLVWLKGEGK